VIVRDDMDRVRRDCGPEVAEEFGVDGDALALSSIDYANNIGPLVMMVGPLIAVSSSWAAGFMAGVRAAREDTL
jgi:hypothetical protein